MSETPISETPSSTAGAETDRSAEIDGLRAEIERLRALVGPSEQSYADLRHDVLAARDAARGAEATAGVLRGQVTELHAELARARQDQDHFQRMVTDRFRSTAARLNRAVRARFF